MRITTNTLRTRSASVRPTSTADRAMGSERNRSSIPDFRSAAKPTAVAIAPNTTVCTKMPGIRKSTYGTPASVGLTAPPNTYRQSSTKITGWIVEKMRLWDPDEVDQVPLRDGPCVPDLAERDPPVVLEVGGHGRHAAPLLRRLRPPPAAATSGGCASSA